MKADRQLSILALLMENGTMTAPQLAERLEVTRRTITRDVEDLCMAGYPLVTRQGAGGGISLAEGFTLPGNLLKQEELGRILTGLHGLATVDQGPGAELLHKLAPSDALISLRDCIVIDLSSQYKESLSEKIGLLKQGIQGRELVSFTYYSERGSSTRTIEPCIILFKWAAWYVFGYCTERRDFRMFKLSRLWELTLTGNHFSPREVPEEEKQFGAYLTDHLPLRALFQKSEQYRLVEEYGPDCCRNTPDGRLLFSCGYTNRENTVSWLLSFGERVEVLEPEEIRLELFERAKKMVERGEDRMR